MTARGRIPDRVDIDAVVANSYLDFHVKGFDYLCLKRSPAETIKLYFFDGNITRLPEVLNPHDHRYDFETRVVCGASENVWFCHSDLGEVFTRFDYFTPLNGGDGFTYAGEDRLREMARVRYSADRPFGYWMAANHLHTIRIVESETVLMIRQFEDVVPIDRPTSTFTRGDKPSLDGLYGRFTADQVIDRLRRFEERTGIKLETYREG